MKKTISVVITGYITLDSGDEPWENAINHTMMSFNKLMKLSNVDNAVVKLASTTTGLDVQASSQKLHEEAKTVTPKSKNVWPLR